MSNMVEIGDSNVGRGTIPPPLPKSSTGRTTGSSSVAGFMQVAQGAIVAIGGVALFAFAASGLGGISEDDVGGSVSLAGFVTVVAGAVLIWSGVSCSQGNRGGRISVIVFQCIFLLAYLGALLAEGFAGPPLAGAAYCGAIVLFALRGDKHSPD